eukprot:GDKK01063815.1.p1 GENE.GDKK01063815.1~~GDKK01063815.1.p1  ORF type:complete len:732 (+),score=185.28 GDKK01063815.1:232-2196(+)
MSSLLQSCDSESKAPTPVPVELLQSFIEFTFILAPDAPATSSTAAPSSANNASSTAASSRSPRLPYILDTFSTILSARQDLLCGLAPSSASNTKIRNMLPSQSKAKLTFPLCFPANGWWGATAESENDTATHCDTTHTGDLTGDEGPRFSSSAGHKVNLESLSPARRLAKTHCMHMFMQYEAEQMNLLNPETYLSGDAENIRLYSQVASEHPEFIDSIRKTLRSMSLSHSVPFEPPTSPANYLPVPLFAALLILFRCSAVVRLASFQPPTATRPFWSALSSFCALALGQTHVSSAPTTVLAPLVAQTLSMKTTDSPAAVLDSILDGLSKEIAWTSLQDIPYTPPTMSPIFRLFATPYSRELNRFVVGASPSTYITMASDAAKLPPQQKASLVVNSLTSSLAAEMLKLPIARLANAPAYLLVALPPPTAATVAAIKNNSSTTVFASTPQKSVSLIPPHYIPLVSSSGSASLIAQQDVDFLVNDSSLIKNARYVLTGIVTSSLISNPLSSNNPLPHANSTPSANVANKTRPYAQSQYNNPAAKSTPSTPAIVQQLQTVRVFLKDSHPDETSINTSWKVITLDPKTDSVGSSAECRSLENLSAVIKQLSTVNGGKGVNGACLLLYTLDLGNNGHKHTHSTQIELSPSTVAQWLGVEK